MVLCAAGFVGSPPEKSQAVAVGDVGCRGGGTWVGLDAAVTPYLLHFCAMDAGMETRRSGVAGGGRHGGGGVWRG